MVAGEPGTGTEDPQLEAIRAVARKALVFGESSGRSAGAAAFEDPVRHAWFLLYIYGSIDYFGDAVDIGMPLVLSEKQTAMADALGAFNVATPEEIRATVLMLNEAKGDAAVRVRAAGAAAAEQWDGGAAEAAAQRFAQLMTEPDALPATLDPALAPLAPTA